jgi:hypothetical protein
MTTFRFDALARLAFLLLGFIGCPESSELVSFGEQEPSELEVER